MGNQEFGEKKWRSMNQVHQIFVFNYFMGAFIGKLKTVFRSSIKLTFKYLAQQYRHPEAHDRG
jgi:hypothetical protein